MLLFTESFEKVQKLSVLIIIKKWKSIGVVLIRGFCSADWGQFRQLNDD